MCVDDTEFNSSTVLFTYPSNIVAFTVGIVSGLGSLCILLSFTLVRDLRATTSRKILCFISLADLGACVTQATGASQYYGDVLDCEIQALFSVIFTLSFVMWTTCLALYLYISLARDDLMLAKRMVNWFHIVGWGLPVTVGLVAFFLDSLGSDNSVATNGWCWVSTQPKVPPHNFMCQYAILLWMLLTTKIWELVSYVLVPFLYIRVKMHIRRVVAAESAMVVTQSYRRAVYAIDRKLVILPIAFVLLRMWGTIRVFLYIFAFYFDANPRESVVFQFFEYMQALGDNGQGAVNFLMFFLLTTKVRTAAVTGIRRACACCCGSSPQSCCSHGDDEEDYYDGYQVFNDGNAASEDTIELSDSNSLARRITSSSKTVHDSDVHRQSQIQRWFRQAQSRMSSYSATPTTQALLDSKDGNVGMPGI
ncbi:G-protein coupled receptor 157-like [Sycon ciliatum]|uniref:G-protein coupled receptor 157-like n=1 Tax=Sycon ciliatum TaxID=27933 RepID=UPI0031F6B406